MVTILFLIFRHLNAPYQSVDSKDGFRVVEDVTESPSVSINQFQSEGLLESTVKRLLTIYSHRIRRLIVDSAIRWGCRLAFN